MLPAVKVLDECLDQFEAHRRIAFDGKVEREKRLFLIAQDAEKDVLAEADRYADALWRLAEKLRAFDRDRQWKALGFSSFKAWAQDRLPQHGVSVTKGMFARQMWRLLIEDLGLPREELIGIPQDSLETIVPPINQMRRRAQGRPYAADPLKDQPITHEEARVEALELIVQAQTLSCGDLKSEVDRKHRNTVRVQTLIRVSDLTDDQCAMWGVDPITNPEAVYSATLMSYPDLVEEEFMDNNPIVKRIIVNGTKVEVRQADTPVRCVKCGHIIRGSREYTRRARYNPRAGIYPHCLKCRPLEERP